MGLLVAGDCHRPAGLCLCPRTDGMGHRWHPCHTCGSLGAVGGGARHLGDTCMLEAIGRYHSSRRNTWQENVDPIVAPPSPPDFWEWAGGEKGEGSVTRKLVVVQ